jgi:FixJ family two-component response regulator
LVSVQEVVDDGLLLACSHNRHEVYSSEFLAAYCPGREGCLVLDAWILRMGGLELLERLKTEHGGPSAIRHPAGSPGDQSE